ncbi:hypothetical protein PYW08_013102 [Mythimna loreyi]|uniref:Uncharacterized protein n=1 Tax=Mythimna loreyi TaxID=667449 RepID=A0ACC2PZ32_9NEOP|nr:hypothetical protein PYW08_013102 [Mythimna loreyi]
MAEFIKELIIELFKIRTYLIKIGPSRRQENICNKKLSEANVLYEQHNNYIEEIKRIKQFKSVSEIEDIDKSGVKFCNLYLEVTNLCKSEPIISATMAKFDLKIALNLLPVMNDTEAVTKQLIDGIEYYDSVLEDASKKELIEFVLKSRLSQFAKLRLAKKYGNVTELLRDMKIHLLPKKSFTAISSKLQSIKQNEKTITDYGQELSSLFVDLTISQSEGHEESYDSLKRVNEKLAIKRFADGLRNRRLSTIIAARNYDSLSDAIQAAIDEETSSSDYTSSNIMSMRRSNGQNYNNYRSHHRGHYTATRGRYYHNNSHPRGSNRRGVGGYHHQRGAVRGRQEPFRGNPSGRGHRGQSNNSYHNNRGSQRNQNQRVMTTNKDDDVAKENVLQFFRD